MKLRIATRGSRLALAQAEVVARLLSALGVDVEVVPMVTAGDRGAPPDASPAGVKGLFVGEIVQAVQQGEVDLAVHSAKDLPAQDPEGVIVGAVPDRADPFDVLVTREDRLDEDGTIGTSSLRRQAQLKRARPSVRVRAVRGNVDTRLRKLAEGEVDALVLAGAGLQRLGITPAHWAPLPLEEMVPAPGQGALAVQVRADDQSTIEAVTALDHARSRAAFEAERALMVEIGGGCALPLGAYAEQREEGVRLLAVVVRPDGSDLAWAQGEAPTPARVASEVAEILRAGGAADILAGLRVQP